MISKNHLKMEEDESAQNRVDQQKGQTCQIDGKRFSVEEKALHKSIWD
jgi:hypothetical protein